MKTVLIVCAVAILVALYIVALDVMLSAHVY